MRMSNVCVIKCLIQIAMHLDRKPNNTFKFYEFSFLCNIRAVVVAKIAFFPFSTVGCLDVAQIWTAVNANRRGAISKPMSNGAEQQNRIFSTIW